MVAEFHRLRSERERADTAGPARQFGIKPLASPEFRCLDERFPQWETDLTQLAVWGANHLERIATEPFAVVCGLKAGAIHLGYLDVIRECDYWAGHGAELYFTPGIHGDGAQDEAAISEMIDRVRGLGYDSLAHCKLVDPFKSPWPQWEALIASVLSYRVLRRLFGWDESVRLDTLRSAVLTTTAFLAPQLEQDRPVPTVVPCGLNEAPSVALAGYAAKKLGFLPPSATYRSYVPGLDGSVRMSSQQENVTVFVSDPPSLAAGKWSRAKTGGRQASEHQRVGGRPLECPFLAAASSVLTPPDTDAAVSACQAGRSCKACKTALLPQLVELHR